MSSNNDEYPRIERTEDGRLVWNIGPLGHLAVAAAMMPPTEEMYQEQEARRD